MMNAKNAKVEKESAREVPHISSAFRLLKPYPKIRRIMR